MHEHNNHIKTYTAQDIDRYLNRQMPEAEMHALERAALEDPFLAEAIEGYVNTSPGSVKNDIEKMAAALDKKTNTRVVSIGFKKFIWSAAAAVIILLGVATTWYWLRPASNSNIAQKKETPAPLATPEVQSIEKDSSGLITAPAQEPAAISSPAEKKVVPPQLPSGRLAGESTDRSAAKREEGYLQTDTVKKEAPSAEKAKRSEAELKEADDLFLKRNQTTDIPKDDVAAAATQAENQRSVSEYIAPRIFSGKITDDKNQALPFVNISIPNTPTSIYSDAQGNFRLTSADTQLVVQLKSVGFEGTKATLYSNTSNNIIQLTPSENSLAEIVVTGYGTTKKRTTPVAKQVKKEEDKEKEEAEAEPKDGWAAYDAYMMNNSRLPDANSHPVLKGTVELSFTVNRHGTLTDFRVELSSCAVCEKEAIRLVKEGPAWKLVSGDKPTRVTLTMHF
ncbi:MAG: carboxypeptidase-like regulatory domain-containing protein [Chitinophagaceae bacterium]|nr:carboxypeptidase-like regulatory domain-containing protein [Chitinophagaceae bacterium]